MVECHIVSSLSHDSMLRFDWLRTCNPYIDWWACILSVNVPGGHHLLAGLPCNSLAHVELASLDFVCKEVDRGAVACLTLVRLGEPPDAMGACGIFASGDFGDA